MTTVFIVCVLSLLPKYALGGHGTRVIDKKSSHDPKLEASNIMTSGERAWLLLNNLNNSETSNVQTETQPPERSSESKSRMYHNDPQTSNRPSTSEFLDNFMDELQPLSERFQINRSTNIDRATFTRINNQAHDGSIDSSYFLGLIYVYGFGLTEPDYSEALRWFKEAAMKGHKEAQCALGILLYNGVGNIGEDRKTAMVSK